MTQPALAHISTDGFDTVQVTTGLISLALVPDLGGKLSQLGAAVIRSGADGTRSEPRPSLGPSLGTRE